MVSASNPLETMAQEMEKSITAAIASTLRQEGAEKARQQWKTLNDTLSCEEWWPRVARAVRKLFDDYAAEQKLQQEAKEAALLAKEKQAKDQQKQVFIINNNNANNGDVNKTIDKVEQLVGVAESGSTIIKLEEN